MLNKGYTVKELYASGFYNRLSIEAAGDDAVAQFSSMCANLGPKDIDPDGCGKSGGGGVVAAVIVVLLLLAGAAFMYHRSRYGDCRFDWQILLERFYLLMPLHFVCLMQCPLGL
jgi:hypothetical protein